jgi:hypothetical protein
MEDGLRPAPAESSGSGSPAALLEITNPFPADDDSFSLQQSPLEQRRSAIPPEAPGCRNHPVAGNISRLAVAHDVANRARRPRSAREFGDVAIGRHLADRDAADGGEDFRCEVCHVGHAWAVGLFDDSVSIICLRRGGGAPQRFAGGGAPRNKPSNADRRPEQPRCCLQPRLKSQSQSSPHLRAARIHLHRATVPREVDRRPCVAHEPPDADVAREHPPDVRARIEPGRGAGHAL